MKLWLKRTLFGVFGASILVGGLTASRPAGMAAPAVTMAAGT